MPETSIRTLVEVQADEQGVQSARRALLDVVEAQKKLTASFARGEIEADDYNKALRDLKKNEQSLSSAIDSATGEITAQKKAMREAADEAKRFADSQAELATSQGAFDRVSADVSLLGDSESGLRTIGGTAGFFGATGVERGLSGAGELLASAEAMPKLVAAAKGLPDALKAATSAIGVGGFGVIGALGALTVAVALLAKQSERATGEIREGLDAQTDAIALAANFTREELLAKKAAAEESVRIAEEQERLAKLAYDEVQKQAEETLSVIELGSARLGAVVGLGGGIAAEMRATGQAANDAKDNLEQMGGELEAINIALKDPALKAAVEEEEKLVEARKETVAVTKRAAKQFKQTGIAFSAASFGLLGTNPAETAAKKKKAEEIAKQFAELEKDAAEREMDLRRDLAEQRFQLQLNEFRDTLDSIRDFSRSRQDALREGNFLQLRDLNLAEKRAAEDRKIEVRRGNKDITREANRSRRELQNQTANSMRELNAEVARGLQGVVNQFQNALASIAGTSSAPRVPFGVSLFASAPRNR